MFTHVRLSNLGPVEVADLALSPKGTTTLSGPSRSGKSTTAAAIAAPWTGRMPSLRDGADKGGVELTTGGGVVIRMGLTPTGASWTVQAKGAEKPTRYQSWAAMAQDPAAALTPARDPELAEAVVLPFGWAPLLTAECGRPLRNLLMRVLPPVSLAERIGAMVQAAGYALDEADLDADTGGKARLPVPADHPDYPDALADTLARKQRDANAEAKAAKATAAEAKRQRDALTVAPDPGPASAHEAAKTTIATARAWDRHDEARLVYDREVTALAQERAALEAWRKGRAALAKERPTVDPSASMVARRKLEEARAEVRRLEREEQEEALRAAVEAARASAAPQPVSAPAAPPDGPGAAAPGLFAQASICPTCNRPLES